MCEILDARSVTAAIGFDLLKAALPESAQFLPCNAAFGITEKDMLSVK
jgi:hypothetical protein